MENEKDVWVPTPEQLRMIDEGREEFRSGQGYTVEEALADVDRRIAAIDKALDGQSA